MIERFEELKMEIKVIQDRARVDIPMCREMSNYKNIKVRIRRNALKGIDPRIDLVPSPPNRNSECVFSNELNLSTIDPPSNRMQRTLEVIEIEDQNFYGSQSNTDCITIGGNSKPSVLHQVKAQTCLVPDWFRVAIHSEIILARTFTVRLIIKTYLVLI